MKYLPLSGIAVAVAAMIFLIAGQEDPRGTAFAKSETEKPKAAADQGKRLYELNCMACHQSGLVLVGPSLAEIAFIHRDNPKGIVEWAIKPGKKRTHMIPMPPMAYVGKDNLQKISRYILDTMKGKEKLDKAKGWKLSPPTGKIQRLLMPDSGPASIAVKLNQNVSYCWDTTTCRLRYAWAGGFIANTWGSGFRKPPKNDDRRQSFEWSTLDGVVFYRTTDHAPLYFASKTPKVDYVGYKVDKQELPELIYRVDGLEVKEKIEPLKTGIGMLRHFKITGVKQTTYFQPSPQDGVTISVSAGTQEDGRWRLTPEQAASFTVKVIKSK